MRVSQRFNLGRTQPTLDFVDVDTARDARLFIDPRALKLLRSEWADECVSLVQDFFRTVLEAIREGRNDDARRLLVQLREPNETHLGLSQGLSHGRALGPESSVKVWEALRDSEAVASGLLEELEDAILMVDGVGWDIVSDITTNIIREPLIQYTQDMAGYFGIPLTEDVSSGPLWDPSTGQWNIEYTRLPTTQEGKLLLVPKIIVRAKMEYDADEYFRHYLLEDLRDEELGARSSLVELLKDGTPRVTKTALIEKYGSSKSVIVEQTLRHPDALRRYRDAKDAERTPRRPPLDHSAIAEAEGTPSPDWEGLLSALTSIPPGRQHFAAYEKATESLLTALFYPSLVNPVVQQKLHQGRKRIDISYTNAAFGEFFGWIAAHYPAAHVFVECKNYGGDPANPELDQLAGRFSPSRGRVGMLVCRSFTEKELFLQRCRDTALDDRGFIIALDDGDLAALVRERQSGPIVPPYELLSERFRRLIM